MKKILFVLAVFALPLAASANPKLLVEYKNKVDKEGKCTTCHATMGKKELNEHGKAFKDAKNDFAVFKK